PTRCAMSSVWSPEPAATSSTREPERTPARSSIASVAVASQARICGVCAFQPAADLSHCSRSAALNARGSMACAVVMLCLLLGAPDDRRASSLLALRCLRKPGKSHNGAAELHRAAMLDWNDLKYF